MKERVISAVVALLITVPFVLLGGPYFRVLAFVLGILGLKELMNLRSKVPNFIKYMVYLLFLVFMVEDFTLLNTTFAININLIILSIFVLFLPVIMLHDDNVYNMNDALFLFASLIFMFISFNSFIIVRDESLYILLYLLFVTSITDTFAYIGGSKYGKTKLIPSISPKKSVEGMIIGTFFGTLIPVVFYYFCVMKSNIFILILVTLLLSLIGQFGDLVFSSIKRHYKIKDFSNLMPGHGGILDRLDSSIFVILAYMIMHTFI